MKRTVVLIVALLIIVGVAAAIYIMRSRLIIDIPVAAVKEQDANVNTPVKTVTNDSEEKTGFGKTVNTSDMKEHDRTEDIKDMTEGVKGAELMGIFETKEEAQKAAELYGIELISYEQQVAVFSIEEGEDPLKIISKGEENGWPELAVNGTNVLY